MALAWVIVVWSLVIATIHYFRSSKKKDGDNR